MKCERGKKYTKEEQLSFKCAIVADEFLRRHIFNFVYLSLFINKLKKKSLLLLKIVKKLTIPLIWVNPAEKWGKQVT